MKKTPLLRKTPMKRGKKPERTPKGCTTVERLLGEGKVFRASSLVPTPKPMKKKSANNDGWYKWAVENVWNKRNHWCEVCGLMLGNSDTPNPAFFSHLLPRGAYRKYKLDERNVIIKCADCHEKWHNMGPEKLKGERDWKVVCGVYYRLRDEANGVKQ